MNTRDKVEWSTTPVCVTQTHKVKGYDNHDKIEIPVVFHLTEECGRVYDRESMSEYLHNIIDRIEEHEKVYA